MNPCKVCGEPVKRSSRTFCSKACAGTARGAKYLGLKCSVDGCESIRVCSGWCEKHWQRVRAHGDTALASQWAGLTPDERFRKHVAQAGDQECWIWTGELINGYGVFCTYANGARHRHLAHRYMMRMLGRLDDESKVVLHACDNPPCVNPAHLSAGTQRDNMRDALAKGRMNMDGLIIGQLGHQSTKPNGGLTVMERRKLRRERKTA